MNNMKEYQVVVYNIKTYKTIDTFIVEFSSIYEVKDYMNKEIHNYKEPYYKLSYFFTAAHIKEKQQPLISSTPSHYQGTIQPIDLINAQDLNFNLGNVVKYVCRAGKKQGENVLSDLEKAKNYINYEIERIKKNE